MKPNQIGSADYIQGLIRINDVCFQQQHQEQAYLHELIHWILFVMGHEMRDEEHFVDTFAHYLHQAMKTAR